MIKDNYENNFVIKPWGFEYLVYENDYVGMWLLYISENSQTSMHCHPNKTTGLVVLDGFCQVNFLENCQILKPSDKIMIRKGLFHSTKSLSQNGSFIFEIETPKNKLDLVRYQDLYGREGQPYENSTHEQPKKEDFLWIPKHINSTFEFLNKSFLCTNKIDKYFFENLPEDSNVIFLNGGLLTEYGVNVISPGDVVKNYMIKKLMNVFDCFHKETLVLIIK